MVIQHQLMLRNAPSHRIYFWTYGYMREQLHPNCHNLFQIHGSKKNWCMMLKASHSHGKLTTNPTPYPLPSTHSLNSNHTHHHQLTHQIHFSHFLYHSFPTHTLRAYNFCIAQPPLMQLSMHVFSLTHSQLLHHLLLNPMSSCMHFAWPLFLLLE